MCEIVKCEVKHSIFITEMTKIFTLLESLVQICCKRRYSQKRHVFRVLARKSFLIFFYDKKPVQYFFLKN